MADFLVESVRKAVLDFAARKKYDCIPTVQHSQALDYEAASGSSSLSYGDLDIYSKVQGNDLSIIRRLESVKEIGIQFSDMLYCMRPLSKCLEENVFTIDASEFVHESIANSKRVFSLMRPYFNRIYELIKYVHFASSTIRDGLSVIEKDDNDDTMLYACSDSIISALDTLLILNTLMNQKHTVMSQDFYIYSQSLAALVEDSNTSQKFASLTNRQDELITFLDPGADEGSDVIYHTLRSEVKIVSGHEEILTKLLELVFKRFSSKGRTIVANDKFQLNRVMTYILLLIDGAEDKDGDDDDTSISSATVKTSHTKSSKVSSKKSKKSNGLNIFTDRKYRRIIKACQEICIRMPLVPLKWDIVMYPAREFSLSPNFQPKTMLPEWGDFGDSDRQKSLEFYDISKVHKTTVASFEKWAGELSRSVVSLRSHLEEGTPVVRTDLAEEIFGNISCCMSLLGSWSTALWTCVIWKIRHPKNEVTDIRETGDESTLATEDISETATNLTSEYNGPDDMIENMMDASGSSYDNSFRKNFQHIEWIAFLEIVSKIKTMESMLQSILADAAPLLNLHIHHVTQQFAQTDLVPLLHRSEKHSQPLLEQLLTIQSICVDWNGADPEDMNKAYQAFSRKVGSKPESAHDERVVALSRAQILLLRANVYGALQKASASSNLLKAVDIEVLENFMEGSSVFEYLTYPGNTLRLVSDLSFLWCRETFVERNGFVQLPIYQSLPWLMVQFLLKSITNSHADLANDVSSYLLPVLEIYNDAGWTALHVLSKQHLYDEVEAEASLALDLLTYHLADMAYSQVKDRACALEMDSRQYAIMLSSEWEAPLIQILSIIDKRQVNLLGRVLDLSLYLSKRIQNMMVEDLSTAISFYESGPVSAVETLHAKINVVRATHKLLSENLQVMLSPFDELLALADERMEQLGPDTMSDTKSIFSGRISFHTVDNIARDIIPNFAYNVYTRRFVRAPVTIHAVHYDEAPSPNEIPRSFGFGYRCEAAMYQACRALEGYFGTEHLEILNGLLGPDWIIAMTQEVLASASDAIDNLNGLIRALYADMLPVDLPSSGTSLLEAFDEILENCQSLREYEDIKRSVFQTFRELGNAILLLIILSEMVQMQSSKRRHLSLPFAFRGQDGSGNDEEDTVSLTMLSSIANTGQMHNNQNDSNPLVKSVPAINLLPDVTNMLSSCMEQTAQLQGSIFAFTMRRIKSIILASDKFQLQPSLRFSGEDVLLSKNQIDSFANVWSYLNFIYCKPSIYEDGEVDSFGNPIKSEAIPNDEEFGHGFTMGGAILLHVLRQRSLYEIFDFSLFLVQMKRMESPYVAEASITSDLSKGNKLDESKSTFDNGKVQRRSLAIRLVKAAEKQHKVMRILFDILDIETPNNTIIDFAGDFPVYDA